MSAKYVGDYIINKLCLKFSNCWLRSLVVSPKTFVKVAGCFQNCVTNLRNKKLISKKDGQQLDIGQK